ncbi:MAG: transketolase [Proteobacteria bacterium]|nr:transketolase [Pseudomonadota bacterium]
MPIFAELANAIRVLSIDAVEKANSGHPGMPMGMADVATVLFTKHMVFNAKDPDWPNRDRFILSAGHGSMLLYSLLYLTGYEEATLEQIKNFRMLNSKAAGHPEYGHLPGVETTTGPLGQGIATAVGMALAERMLNARYENAIDHYTYVMASDGDLMEGISHEAASLAGHLQLNKLIVLYDDNGISIDGKTDLSFSDHTIKRFEAYNWHSELVDGHDHLAIDAAITRAKRANKPSLIACKTTIGYGAPHKANTSGAHGSPLGKEETMATRLALKWYHGPFDIPAPILNEWRAAGEKSLEVYDLWQKETAPEIKELLQRPKVDIDKAINDYKQSIRETKPFLATRVLSQRVLEAIASGAPLIGGSADLTGSNNTKIASQEVITAKNYKGNYIHYGVREHAMAAIMNGISLSKAFIPYGGTFLVFLDYLKPAFRLSALMQQGVIYVLTHDSIGLGEDGPTHQPIEHLASLRCIPNVLTFRPMDAVETAECWQLALQNRNTPSVLVLTRQNLPYLSDTRVNHFENACAKGGYVLVEKTDSLVTLIATGSEVSIAVDAANKLKALNISSRVVSMPCVDLFSRQPKEYQDKVFGKGLRVVIEAACEGVWPKYLGDNGIFVGMDSFGASAPASDLYEHFGITAERVVMRVKAKLGKSK